MQRGLVSGTTVDSAALLLRLQTLADREALARLLRTDAMTEALIDVMWAEVATIKTAGPATYPHSDGTAVMPTPLLPNVSVLLPWLTCVV